MFRLRGLGNRILRKDDGLWLVILLYAFSFGLNLFNSGVFWDDWAIWHHPVRDLLEFSSNLGAPWTGYYHSAILFFGSAIPYRLLTFSYFLIAVIALYGVLRSIPEIPGRHRFFILGIFALYPVNPARIAITVSNYGMSYASFFAGLYFLVRYLDGAGHRYRWLSAPLFFLSFLTNSFLVFYSIPLLLIGYKQMKGTALTVKNLFRKLAPFADFLVYPIAYYLFQSAAWPVGGQYAGYYHKIQWHRLLNPFRQLFYYVAHAFLNVILNPMFLKVLIPTLILSPLLVFLFKKNILTDDSTFKKSLVWLFFGGFTFIAAAFPYFVLGKGFFIGDWDSRNQLLVPLSAAFILFYGSNVVLNHAKWMRFIQMAVLSVLLSYFTFSNVQYALDFHQDTFKQDALMYHIYRSPTLRGTTTIMFQDEAKGLNAIKRVYRQHEYSGFLREVFGSSTRLGEEDSRFKKQGVDFYYNLQKYPIYNFRDWSRTPPQTHVMIVSKGGPLRNVAIIKVLFWRLFVPKKYEVFVSGYIDLRVTPRS